MSGGREIFIVAHNIRFLRFLRFLIVKSKLQSLSSLKQFKQSYLINRNLQQIQLSNQQNRYLKIDTYLLKLASHGF